MTAAMSHSKPKKMSLLMLGLCLVAAVGIGVARMTGGPDLTHVPDVIDTPVVLSDGRALYVQRHEVTISEWNTCVAQGGCKLRLRARPGQDASVTPATGLSYVDVQEYVRWITHTTDHRFRLPTAAEWNELAAPVLPEDSDPIFTDPSLTWASAYLIEESVPRALKPQGSFSTSPDGIADLDGSVWEWTQECYDSSTLDAGLDRCPAYFVGGEHVAVMSYLIRDPARGGCAVGSPPAHLGMRLVTETPP